MFSLQNVRSNGAAFVQIQNVNMKSTMKKMTVALLVTAGALLIASQAEAQQGPQPSICTRPCWGARAPGSISYMSALSRAIVHHTAGSGDYTTSFETGKTKVRGIQNYHMDVQGWGDIGYHFLVNAGGHIYEGRHASMGSLPRGAHDGCNANSFGFNVMGYYHSPYYQTFTAASKGSLEAVIAWRMPGSWSPYGSGSYCSVSVGTLDGHNRVKATACPGSNIIPSIPSIRDGVAAKKSGCDINMTQGAIRAKYESLGGCSSFLGAPTTYETATPDGIGRYNHFKNNGSIYWTPDTGAWSIWGNIRTKWSELGWEGGVCGYPITDENTCPDGVGKYNHFNKGCSIYWTPTTGAHQVGGSIRVKWEALGWEGGICGYPLTDESPAADGVGRYNHFSKNNASIYWHPNTGAWSVMGAIKDKWASMGWEMSCHGYPISDEYDWNGGRRSDFQNGYIHWTPASGAVSSCGAPPPLPPVDVILDNSSAGFSVTGTAWSTGTSATDKYGADYRFRSTAAVSEPASWIASLSAAGNYAVSAWWAQGANRSASAPYVVYHTGGTTTVNVNQQANGGRWNSLGTYNLASGNNQVRLSCWTTTGFIVLADAIRWQQQ
jgi:hypothetical protein